MQDRFSMFRLPPAQRHLLRTTKVIERLSVQVR
jgi:transposase-like protein